ncbi:MAG: hypothetical protein N2748_06615 [candidate division WOR-3 bacterium]|nr:hypothetical protein [candidate division WOR-3 bacterium]
MRVKVFKPTRLLFWRLPSCLLIAVFLFLGSINFACQKSYQITDDLQAPDFKDGESFTYGYFRNDSLIGKTRMSLYFDTDGEIPIYCLETVTEREMPDDYITDSSVVHFRRDNFRPIWSYRMLETDLGWTITEVHYNEKDIDIWFETIDGRETFALSLSPPYFDSEMLLALLRAVQFKKSKKYTFNVVNPLMLTSTKNSVRYCAKIMIPMPQEYLECDKLQLNTPFKNIELFYERKLPRRLIKFQEKKSDVIAVLLNE